MLFTGGNPNTLYAFLIHTRSPDGTPKQPELTPNDCFSISIISVSDVLYNMSEAIQRPWCCGSTAFLNFYFSLTLHVFSADGPEPGQSVIVV